MQKTLSLQFIDKENKMNKEELQALHEVIDYMWEDEKKSYEECYDCDLSDDFDYSKENENHDHMFVYLMTLSNYACGDDFYRVTTWKEEK